MKKRFIWILIPLLLTALAFSRPAEHYFEIAKNLDIFATLFKEVNTFYVDEVNPETLMRKGIDEMLLTLDPYTDFMTEAEAESFKVNTTGQYAGIGALIGIIRNQIYITHPYEGFPARRAGLQVGDQVLLVNGVPTTGLNTTQVSQMLKGQPKTEVNLSIRRAGKEVSFTIKRERINLKNVTYTGMVDPITGYIRLDEFTPNAAREVQESVRNLKSQGAKQLILDLRNNPGGLLHEAVNIVSLFLPKGTEIVKTKGKVQEWNKTYVTLNPPDDLDIPLAILVGSETASAAEIVSGSLQDYDRAVLVGTRTFGKGLVQTTRPLAYNSQLKITTARYYIPSGRCIQALDYAKRDEAGRATRVADSLRTAFKTRNGRVVYDGGGLEPDLVVPDPSSSVLVEALAASDLLFLFAAQYQAEHPIPPADFKISEAVYSEFRQYLTRNNFTYTTILEHELGQLQHLAKSEAAGAEIEARISDIRKSLKQAKEKDFIDNKEEVKALLRNELAFHYGLYETQAKVSLPEDPGVLEARRILGNQQQYLQLLTKK